MTKIPIILILICGAIGCAQTQTETGPGEPPSESGRLAVVSTSLASAPTIPFKVLATHKHDPSLYTEGLFVHNGRVYEGTGSPKGLPDTRSLIGILNLDTGELEEKVELDRKIYFGEGVVLLKNKIYQLTYRNQKGFIYDASNFQKIGEFYYQNKEGWGFTTDGEKLIMSDGTSVLTYRDPDNLEATRSLQVKRDGTPIDRLNELEYIDGFIYANIWMTDYIVKIDPRDGNVVGKVDIAALAKDALSKNKHMHEPNGIAYDANTRSVYITGKMWPTIYQLDVER